MLHHEAYGRISAGAPTLLVVFVTVTGDISGEAMPFTCFYIMGEKLIEDRYFDYEKFVRTFEPTILKTFLACGIDHIDVDDGRVVSITFQNGIKHSFTYKG